MSYKDRNSNRKQVTHKQRSPHLSVDSLSKLSNRDLLCVLTLSGRANVNLEHQYPILHLRGDIFWLWYATHQLRAVTTFTTVTLVSGGTANVREKSPYLRSFTAYPASERVDVVRPATTTWRTRLSAHVESVMRTSRRVSPGSSRCAVRTPAS